jgi:hypothetical protein
MLGSLNSLSRAMVLDQERRRAGRFRDRHQKRAEPQEEVRGAGVMRGRDRRRNRGLADLADLEGELGERAEEEEEDQAPREQLMVRNSMLPEEAGEKCGRNCSKIARSSEESLKKTKTYLGHLLLSIQATISDKIKLLRAYDLNYAISSECLQGGGHWSGGTISRDRIRKRI